MVGGDLSGIPTEWFWDRNDEASAGTFREVERELNEVRRQLLLKKRVIVGHNLFTDLGFLYATFVGPLPGNVKQFQEKINRFFPVVFDTKYIATQAADSMTPRFNLKELLAPFKDTHMPLIVLHEEHTAYGSSFRKEHEAGYDSMLLSLCPFLLT